MNEHDPLRAEQPILEPLLEHLRRNGEDERVRELATSVLNGEVNLREALTADPYAESLRPGLTNFTRWYEQLDEDALAKQVTQIRGPVEAPVDEY